MNYPRKYVLCLGQLEQYRAQQGTAVKAERILRLLPCPPAKVGLTILLGQAAQVDSVQLEWCSRKRHLYWRSIYRAEFCAENFVLFHDRGQRTLQCSPFEGRETQTPRNVLSRVTGMNLVQDP